jgi:hypothetical protein
MRRTVVTLAVIAPLLAVVALALPSGAQTTSTDTSSTTTTTFVTPGMVDALLITGAAACTPAGSYEVTFTLRNVWTTTIGFYAPNYTQRGYDSSDSPDGILWEEQQPVQLAPIAAGASAVVTLDFPGGRPGIVVLQTEAMFGDDSGTAGPVGADLRIDGSCRSVAVAANAVFTG